MTESIRKERGSQYFLTVFARILGVAMKASVGPQTARLSRRCAYYKLLPLIVTTTAGA